MRIFQKYSRIAGVIAILSLLGLAGCSGGDNNTTTQGTINTPISITGTVISITGVVIKGPMSGSSITLTDATTGAPIKNKNGALLPAITTATDGSWSIKANLAAGVTGPFIVTATNGSYLDEYSGVSVPFAGQSMQGVIPSSNVHQQALAPAISDKVVITPITHAIALQAKQTIADGYAAATVVDALIQDAYTTYQFNPVVTVPESVTTNANASASSQQYEALLGGISTILNKAGVDPYSTAMAQAAVNFAVDIIKDGYALSTAPALNNVVGFIAANAVSLLPTDAYGSNLSIAAQQYVNANNGTLAVTTVKVAGTSKTAGTTAIVTPIVVGAVAITGTAMDGPLAGANIVITDSIGNQFFAMTAADGSYNVSVPKNSSLPLEIVISGGIDTVTGAAPAFPVSTMVTTPMTNVTNLTANANAITSMIVTTAKARAAGGVVSTAILNAATTDVVAVLGLGLDPAINPITTPLSAANVAAILKASQGLSELLTRTAIDNVAANNKANTAAGLNAQATVASADVHQVMASLAADLADGILDGLATAAALTASAAAVNATAQQSSQPVTNIVVPSATQAQTAFSLSQINTVQVGSELLTNQLSLTNLVGTTTNANATQQMNVAGSQLYGTPINVSNVVTSPALQTQLNKAITTTNALVLADSYSATGIPMANRQTQLATLNTSIGNVFAAPAGAALIGAQTQLQLDMANSAASIAATRADALQSLATQLLQAKVPSSSPNIAKAKNSLRAGNVAIAKADFSAAHLANPKDIEAALGLCASQIAEISADPALRILVGQFTTDAGASLPPQATIAAELVGAATAPVTAPFNPYATTVWQQIQWAKTGAQLAATAANATLLQDPALNTVHASLGKCITWISQIKAAGFTSQIIQHAGSTQLWDIADLNSLLSMTHGARGAMDWSRAYNWNTDANLDGVPDTQSQMFIDAYGSYQYNDIAADPVASLNDPMFFTLAAGGMTNLTRALQDFYAAADLQAAFLSDMYANIPRSQDTIHVFTYQNQPAQQWWLPFNPLALPNAIGNDLTSARDVAKALSVSGLAVNNIKASDGTTTSGTVFGQNIFLSPFDRNTFPTFSYAIAPNIALSKKHNQAVLAETGFFWDPVVQADIIVGTNYDTTLAGVLGTGLTLDILDNFQRPVANLQLLDSYGAHLVDYSDWFITDGFSKIIVRDDGTNTIFFIDGITGIISSPITLATASQGISAQAISFSGGVLRIAYDNINTATVESFDVYTGALLGTVTWPQVNLANGDSILGFTSDSINDYMSIGQFGGVFSTLYTAVTPAIIATQVVSTAMVFPQYIRKLLGTGAGVVYADAWLFSNKMWKIDTNTGAITAAQWNPLAGGSYLGDVSILGNNAYVYNGGGVLHTYTLPTAAMFR
ncbi:MAG: hypothetical protein R8L53_08615 [Mariprofundales bacterium]